MKNTILKLCLVICYAVSLCVVTASGSCSEKSIAMPVLLQDTAKRFTNPLMNGADPWVFQKDGFYYYLHTTGVNLTIWKTDKMSTLNQKTGKIIYTPAASGPNTKHIWAPELHFLNGKWYIYYTAGDGADVNQRLWVLENSSADPTEGVWIDKGRIFNSNANFFSIDGSVVTYENSLYFVWSGRPDTTNKNLQQNVYLSKMANPWTLQGEVILLTEPEYSWERKGFPVNEGPQGLINKEGQLFLVYSACFCGTDDYALGMLTLKKGGNPLSKTDWIKSTSPVFSKKVDSNAYAPGHNSFFKSKDGTEDWILYHTNTNAGDGCGGKRNVRMQKFTWNTNGTPNFGEPVGVGVKMGVPSGE